MIDQAHHSIKTHITIIKAATWQQEKRRDYTCQNHPCFECGTHAQVALLGGGKPKS
jgi:hypothetical protein